ncbi:hypothetical protein [uncultured Thermosynechococcus sp.]|uniref:hypothetical protein n=1 Tax=uncultured Thermosynechococcus sp. TaxID=436945 RepID=UPI00261F49C6|nr:hypothetical protein [uncultured Thermosynechococcus sp.]
MPIPVYGDHGVALSGEFEEYEINNRADYHLSWYSKRVESLKRYNKKKIIHITHPWVIYRKMAGYNLRENAKGTIVFYPHSTPTDEIIDYDWDSYFLELKSLDTNYKPIVICMHRHDVVKGYHKNIRKYEVPIVSAGEPSSPLFVDRFYDIVSNFRYATSPTGGSELFYCEEMGIRYFIFGKEPIYHNFSHPQNPLGVLRPKDEVAVIANEIKRNLFSNLPPKDDFRKQQFVSDVLGLDLDHLATAKVLRKIFIFETIRLLPIIFQIAITKLLIKVLIKAKRLVLNIRN